MLKFKQSNFLETEHIDFRVELFWRERGRNITVCPKYEIASGSDKKAILFFFLAADATRKVVETTVGETVLLVLARGQLRTFGPTYDFEIFRLADPGCISFFRNI